VLIKPKNNLALSMPENKTGNALYRDMEVCSCNNCCSRKAGLHYMSMYLWSSVM